MADHPKRPRNDPTAAARSRLKRERRKSDVEVYPIPIRTSDLIDTLIEGRRLAAWDAEASNAKERKARRAKLIEATAKLLADLIKDHA